MKSIPNSQQLAGCTRSFGATEDFVFQHPKASARQGIIVSGYIARHVYDQNYLTHAWILFFDIGVNIRTQHYSWNSSEPVTGSFPLLPRRQVAHTFPEVSSCLSILFLLSFIRTCIFQRRTEVYAEVVMRSLIHPVVVHPPSFSIGQSLARLI